MKKTALDIIELLKKEGYKAYIAGGAVRDILLSIKPKDYDVATNAKVDEIERIVPNTIPIGKEFGVILAKRGTKSVEIATFRKDIKYEDGRRPSKVIFTNEKEDALRRDFTINGMFLDPTTNKVIDYIEGKKDLKKGLIRFIGNPEKRIKEDHLRIIRAVRFKNEFGFKYDPATYKAIKKHVALIKKLSMERIHDELVKMFSQSNSVRLIEDLEDVGILKILLPELFDMKGVEQPPKYHLEGDVWIHTLRCLEKTAKSANYLVRLGVLFHDLGKPATYNVGEDGRIHFYGHPNIGADMTKKILKRLKFSKKEIEAVTYLVKFHSVPHDVLKMKPNRRISWFQKEYFSLLLEVARSDTMRCIPCDLKDWKKVKKMHMEWKKSKQKELKPLLMGKDIMEEFGIPEGKKIGKLLDEVHEKYLDGEIKNREEAMKFVKKNS